MIIIHNYKMVLKGKRYYVKNMDKEVRCEQCNMPMKVRGSKKRKVINVEGDIKYFQLRQLYCEHCKRVHLECPDIIEPNKHYMSEVITDAISNEFSSCCAESTTIQRWKKELNSK